jgi:hypothetical protein
MPENKAFGEALPEKPCDSSQKKRLCPLDPGKLRHQEIESGHTVGKIVINFKEQSLQ